MVMMAKGKRDFNDTQYRDKFNISNSKLSLSKCLSELPFQFMPFTFELEFGHDQIRKGLGSMPERMERPDRCESKSIRLSRHCSSHSP